ncbi:MAG: hypothetical protein ACKOAH_25375, partial [Pirellula sp.]
VTCNKILERLGFPDTMNNLDFPSLSRGLEVGTSRWQSMLVTARQACCQSSPAWDEENQP